MKSQGYTELSFLCSLTSYNKFSLLPVSNYPLKITHLIFIHMENRIFFLLSLVSYLGHT